MSIQAKYNHRFRVNAPLTKVAEFHRQPASMAAITPPPVRVKFHQIPPILANGSEMDFTLWLGVLPIRWEARIEHLSETGFSDRQIKGPFAAWVHEHEFVQVEDAITEINDRIYLQLKPHLFWWWVGLSFYLGLPLLFKYRAWKTRRILEVRSG
jgi:ligand-binding SRPBCC domain-containing protein